MKQMVNELLRLGIVAKKSAVQRQPRYSTPELDAGPCKYPDLDNIGEILAIEHGLILCSTDCDFSRFPGLKWENPIS